MLARRSCQERQDYLYEVECCRGQEEAEALRREVERFKMAGCQLFGPLMRDPAESR